MIDALNVLIAGLGQYNAALDGEIYKVEMANIGREAKVNIGMRRGRIFSFQQYPLADFPKSKEAIELDLRARLDKSAQHEQNVVAIRKEQAAKQKTLVADLNFDDLDLGL
jgi:hypothetical protein